MFSHNFQIEEIAQAFLCRKINKVVNPHVSKIIFSASRTFNEFYGTEWIRRGELLDFLPANLN